MIDLKKYNIFENESDIIINDLIALGNVEMKNVDSIVISDIDNIITIEGEYTGINNKYAVAGGEIVRIISSVIDNKNTVLTLERACKGTLKEDTTGFHFRTVVIVDEKSTEIELLDFNYEDTTGNVTNNLFPVELGSGTVSLKSDLSLWSPYSISKKYDIQNKKSVVYIFKGVNDIRFLKFTTLINKLGFNTRGQKETNKITLNIKSKLLFWYDKDLAINQQLKGTNPKDFFKIIFGLKDNEVYFANGVKEDSFLKINNLHTKEYKTVAEILKAYCSNGVRFAFDAKERVKIFGDFNIDNIVSQKDVKYNLTNSSLTENELMIYNTISTQSVQRQTLYNFEDLDNKYVMFAKYKANIISSDKIISLAPNKDLLVEGLTIKDADLHSAVQLKDYVLLRRTKEPFIEIYAQVLGIEKDNAVLIMPIIGADKDYKLFNYGKNTYLYNILNNDVCPMDLYYVRQALPIIWKFTRNKNGEEKDSSLSYPLLPRVDGVTKYDVEISATFGAPNNLKIGQYANIVEQIDKIYGTFDSSSLLYNREFTQFNNTVYPPIFALTNKVTERKIGDASILNYTTFDNSDFLLQVIRPSENKGDATLKLSNNMNVNSGIDLYVDTEIARLGNSNRILQVDDISAYKLGDVLIVNKPDDLTDQEEIEFDEVLSTIRWTVIAKESQSRDGVTKHYIMLDSDFAKRKSVGKKYSFTRFPNSSIIFLQELYFRGNPVIEYSQDIYGTAKTVNRYGETSKETYGEKKYELDAKQLDKTSLRYLMGYILHNFQATDIQTTKLNVPISVFNGIDIELFDVITINDPNHTKITENIKWVVISVTIKNQTNNVELKLLNINSKNTEPYKVDIKDAITYEPIIIPDYDHTGGEGTGGSNDGNGGEDTDDTLGMVALGEVDTKLFRARVERFEGNYIYFKDFNGEKWEDYVKKLFPESEFAVNIGGEVIFVQSDQNYRAFIKKRNMYGTEETLNPIAPESDVKFLVLTSFVDYDGTLYARKAHFGDNDTYLDVHPITGVVIVGDFRVGENNKNPNNDLWNAMQNNRVFRQQAEPVNTATYTLKDGDVWYDTDDGNKVYIYKTNTWVNTQDQDIVQALGNAKIFYQPEPPVEGMKPNDLWYDTDDQNHPYVYINNNWESARDKVFETEGGNKVYFQKTAPTLGEGYPLKEGDMWFDTGNNNIMYVLIRLDNGNLNWQLADDSLNKINTGRIILNGNTTVSGDFKVRNGNVELGGDTKVVGVMEVFGGSGLRVYNGATEALSTKRVVILGGEILFQEKV